MSRSKKVIYDPPCKLNDKYWAIAYGCHGCRREPTEGGCDLLESEAADAIEFLLKEIEKMA